MRAPCRCGSSSSSSRSARTCPRCAAELAALARASTESTYAQEQRVLRLNLVLFAVAVVVGLGLSAAGAKSLVRALRRLVDGARAIEAGDFAAKVPVTSKDEIGQLAEAFNHMAEELRTKERIKDTFGKYLDPRVVARLIDTSQEDMDQAERRVATVLFSDLKGFTSMSEQLTATAMVRLLNRYFTVVSDQIRAHNGVVEKYIGDAIMAFWAPPFSAGDDHAASACLAALAHRDAVIALRPGAAAAPRAPPERPRAGRAHGTRHGRGGDRHHRRAHRPSPTRPSATSPTWRPASRA